MINKVQKHEQEVVLDILRKDPSRSMFIYGDILQNGWETDYQEVWIDRSIKGIDAIYLRYHKNLVVYAIRAIEDVEALKTFIHELPIQFLSGCKKHLELLGLNTLNAFGFREMYFCECQNLINTVMNTEVTMAEPKHAKAIAEAIIQISEFAEMTSLEERIERIIERLSSGKGRAAIILDGDKVIAHANTAVETDHAVMVGAVLTLPAYRNQGLASQVVSTLTKHCLDDGKIPCLFYDNPKAGSIYHRLGYKTFDTWMMGVKR